MQRHLRIGRGILRDIQPIQIQLDNAQVLSYRQRIAKTLLGEQQLDTAVLSHIGQPLSGVSRIQRHIGPPRLENSQQPHHHFDRALHSDAHPRLRFYA